MLLVYGRRSPPFGLYAALSSDLGHRWTRPILLQRVPDVNSGYSSTVELDDGTLFTANYCSKTAGSWPTGPNGAPMGLASEDDPTGIVGTLWRPPRPPQ